MARKTNSFERLTWRYLKMLVLTRRPATVRQYRSSIKFFIRYVNTHHPALTSFSQLDRSHIERWMRHLATKKSRCGRPLQKATRRQEIIRIRHFLEEITAWGWKDAPRGALFRTGDIPPEDRYLPRPVSEETDRALKEDLRKQGGMISVALLLLRATGLRSQELLDLQVNGLEELPESRWALRVPVGKLHSERVIPLDAEAAEMFREILGLRGDPSPIPHPDTGEPTHFLIVCPSGKRPSSFILRYNLIRARERARLKEHVTPHRLRHTYATEMVRAGMSLPVLAKILGHRTIRMTMRYVAIVQADVHREFSQAMEWIKGRYEIPQPPQSPSAQTPGDAKDTQEESLLSLLERVRSQMEAFRRDNAKGGKSKEIHRLVERLQRIARDLRTLLS